jgi:hypothetical protein
VPFEQPATRAPTRPDQFLRDGQRELMGASTHRTTQVALAPTAAPKPVAHDLKAGMLGAAHGRIHGTNVHIDPTLSPQVAKVSVTRSHGLLFCSEGYEKSASW